jgi:hypothetical protein
MKQRSCVILPHALNKFVSIVCAAKCFECAGIVRFSEDTVPEEKFAAASLSHFSLQLLQFLPLSVLPSQDGVAHQWQDQY